MSYCVELGAKLVDDAKYCTSCGSEVIKLFFCPRCGTMTENRDKFKWLKMAMTPFWYSDNYHLQYCEKCRWYYLIDSDRNIRRSIRPSID